MMRALVAVSLLALLPATAAFSQAIPSQRWSVGFFLEGSLPLGTFGEYSGLGFGIGGRAGYTINANFELSVRTGFVHFSGRRVGIPRIDLAIPTPSTSAIPLLLRVQHLVSSSGETRPFVAIESGVYFFRSNLSILGFTLGGSDRQFGFSPVAGIQLRGNETTNFPAEIGFTEIVGRAASTRWLSIRGGASFTIW